jgi:hypothetical protein
VLIAALSAALWGELRAADEATRHAEDRADRRQALLSPEQVYIRVEATDSKGGGWDLRAVNTGLTAIQLMSWSVQLGAYFLALDREADKQGAKTVAPREACSLASGLTMNATEVVVRIAAAPSGGVYRDFEAHLRDDGEGFVHLGAYPPAQ